MFMFGVSLNIMSLGGLTLGIGLLVDNSIVVLEAIQRNIETRLLLSLLSTLALQKTSRQPGFFS